MFIRLAFLHLCEITFGIMAESSVGQRFSQLIQQLGMSKNAFAMSLDKTATVIQHLVDERNKPGFDLMCKVFEVYPNVSKDWLLLGNGPMLLSDAGPRPLVSAPAAADLAPAAPIAAAKPIAAPAVAPSFPEPLFSVSAARPPVAEVPAAPAATAPQPAPALGAAPPAALPLVPQPPMASPGPVVPAAPVATLDASALTAALHAQYLQHQLALAEQRNQHLLEQQALMQQMLDLMRRTI